MTSHPTLVWAGPTRTFRGVGPIEVVDPGVGPGRYGRAREALRDSGRSTAMASFTFDLDEPGSVVAIPKDTVALAASSNAEPTNWNGTWGGEIVDSGYGRWSRGMAGALESINADIVEKVVLTRKVDAEFEADVDVETVVNRLLASQPDSMTFAVDALVGASPELLISLSAGQVTSVALAGTGTHSSDLASEKMDREHTLSQMSVEEGLAPHVTALTIDERKVQRFGHINHLATRFDGTATPEASILDILGTLHPTAAVAGTPKDTAIKTIKELEQRSRGRYAGPVGWFDSNGEGEFAIALRCAHLDGRSAVLYAGGGIVAGSDTDSEFAETELKLAPMLHVLGLA